MTDDAQSAERPVFEPFGSGFPPVTSTSAAPAPPAASAFTAPPMPSFDDFIAAAMQPEASASASTVVPGEPAPFGGPTDHGVAAPAVPPSSPPAFAPPAVAGYAPSIDAAPPAPASSATPAPTYSAAPAPDTAPPRAGEAFDLAPPPAAALPFAIAAPAAVTPSIPAAADAPAPAPFSEVAIPVSATPDHAEPLPRRAARAAYVESASTPSAPNAADFAAAPPPSPSQLIPEPAGQPAAPTPWATASATSVASVSAAPPAPGEGQPGSDPDIVAALNAVVTSGASDLHISAKAQPQIRVDGSLRAIEGSPVWTSEKVRAALTSIMSERHREQFADALELDFAYTLSSTARFRVNVYQQRESLGAAFRLIPTQIKPLDQLGIPDKVARFAGLARGLVLVTGPTGSGKSTTLAALIDMVNSTRADHVVTVEDPIEFMHQNKKSLVNQREVGQDTHSFANALKHVLRQDPDVILIGELRDLETISVALTAAETGHLVFATLHTQDAAQTIDRVIDVFPPHQQGQVRTQLAATLQGVVCQTLVKRVGGAGRAVATEVLMMTPAIANLIREGKTYQVRSAMQAGRDQGMHTMDQHLAELVASGAITADTAYERAQDLDDLRQLIQRGSGGAATGSSGRSFQSDLEGFA